MKSIKTTLVDNEEISLSKTVYQKGMLMDPHYHEHPAISVVLKGAVHETVDNTTNVGHAAQVIIKPQGTIHANHYSGDCTILCLYVKDIAPSAFKQPALLERWNWKYGSNIVPLFLDLINQSSKTAIRQNVDIILNILNESDVHAPVPRWLADVKTVLDETYHQPIVVEKLAEMFKVHRVYLSRAFKMYYGLSIKAYLKNIRLHRSVASVIEDETFTDTALSNGFSDQSHFNRLFKESLNMTPGNVRSLFQSKVSFVQDME